MIIFTVSKSGVVAYGQSGVQADWNGMTDDEKNTIIEEIIEECDKMVMRMMLMEMFM